MSAPANDTGGWRLTDAFAKNPPPVPKGKNADDYIYFDEKLSKFGLRKRDGNLTWIVQYRVRGKTKRRRIGDVEGPLAITAKDARQQAEKRLADITLGADPHSSRGGQKLGPLLQQYVDGLDAGTIGIGRGRKRKIKPRSLDAIKTDFKHWHDLEDTPLHLLDRKAVSENIRDVTKASGPSAARNARKSLSGFYRWAVGEGIAKENPVTGTNTPPQSDERKRVLDDSELVDVWNACRDDDYGRIIKLLLLTGQRRQEVAAMADSEIDLTRRIWTLPGERTKNRFEHQVPLTNAALDILAAQPRRVGRDLLFGNQDARPFSGWSAAKKRLDARIKATRKAAGRPPIKPWILHDLRRTLRTGLGGLGVMPWIAEAVLNHIPPKLVRTYAVTGDQTETNLDKKLTAEKRKALDLWAAHVKKLVPDEPTINVVRMKA
jgi:integrase